MAPSRISNDRAAVVPPIIGMGWPPSLRYRPCWRGDFQYAFGLRCPGRTSFDSLLAIGALLSWRLNIVLSVHSMADLKELPTVDLKVRPMVGLACQGGPNFCPLHWTFALDLCPMGSTSYFHDCGHLPKPVDSHRGSSLTMQARMS